MSMLAIHPAYWRHGNGTRLVQWSKSLSDMDNICQSVSAAAMGEKLYMKLGYRTICRMAEEGDEEDPIGVYTDLMEYCPVSKTS